MGDASLEKTGIYYAEEALSWEAAVVVEQGAGEVTGRVVVVAAVALVVLVMVALLAARACMATMDRANVCVQRVKAGSVAWAVASIETSAEAAAATVERVWDVSAASELVVVGVVDW
jgi:hypothetical protein